jgi:hypothetical protein
VLEQAGALNADVPSTSGLAVDPPVDGQEPAADGFNQCIVLPTGIVAENTSGEPAHTGVTGETVIFG